MIHKQFVKSYRERIQKLLVGRAVQKTSLEDLLAAAYEQGLADAMTVFKKDKDILDKEK